MILVICQLIIEGGLQWYIQAIVFSILLYVSPLAVCISIIDDVVYLDSDYVSVTYCIVVL